MALTSPGVEVSVIDESFYTPAEPGTTPMIFVATAANKQNASGTGTAQGTLAANAGVPYLLTSQRDLADTFGDPLFYTDNNNNPINGGELNEYGLQAAYSLLGVSNRAWVVRADLDLSEIAASATAPAADPADGTYWFDTQTTAFGIQEWNGAAITVTGGQSFTTKTPIVITDSTQTSGSAPYTPKTSVGSIGDYAVVAVSTTNRIWYKTAGYGSDAQRSTNAGSWVEVGSANWKASHATVTGSENPTVSNGATMTVNGTTITSSGTTATAVAQDITTALNASGIYGAVVDSRLVIVNDGSSVDTIALVEGTGLLAELGLTAGTFYNAALQISRHTSVPEWKTNDTQTRPTGSVWLKSSEPNAGARWRVKEWNDETQLWEQIDAPIYADNTAALYNLDLAGGGANLSVGDLYVQSNIAEDDDPLATFKIFRRESAGSTSITSSIITSGTITGGNVSFTVSESDAGSSSMSSATTVSFSASGMSSDADTIAGAINSAGLENVTASVSSTNRVTISHTQGGEIRFVDTDGVLVEMGFAPFVDANTGTANFYYVPGTDVSTDPKQFMASNWKVLSYTASDDEVTSLTADNRLWYNSIVDEVDILIHNGTSWIGYHNYDFGDGNTGVNSELDPAGPIVAAAEPTTQSDGSALVTGDLWIDTSDLENYPTIYQYNSVLSAGQKWVLLDTTDQTTENGVLFADARWSTSGGSTAGPYPAAEIADLLTSNYLDPDAPDPALYPKGMLLWNLRRSGFNVKKFVRNSIDTAGDNARNSDEAMENYYPHRWVTESANQADGAGSFGRKAQRKVVVQSLQAMLNSNDAIRDDESRIFNLMATPGYPELIGEMVSLNYDRGLTAFVVGDSPARLTSDATSINNWATNVNLAVEDNDDGLVTRDEYLGVFYPWGFTSDNFGNNVVVPPSHMMLRTIALSDQVSFPWFAPAGTRRGGITNASSTGYIDSEGEFEAIALNEGQRDTLYAQNVNPITFISGAGLVNFGQKTRARGASALDRINVARLVIYLRSQLNQLAKPYIFEPNDKITRDEIKQQAESLMLELVGQRALYDFLVVCDESNNTPSRIDRNELYLDIAIEPVKAVEFIYIPLRLKNTGEIAGL